MPVPRVVLDTNVVVSAHLNAAGYERFVLDLSLAGKLEWYLSDEILAEYEGVLRRPKFAIDSAKLDASLDLIRQKAKRIRPGQELAVTADPADNKFLECAQAAAAEYLVTGNKRHFPKTWKKTKVVNARELINVIAADLQK